MIENLKAFFGLCLVVGAVGLPVNFVLGKLNLLDKELYQKIKFCKIVKHMLQKSFQKLSGRFIT